MKTTERRADHDVEDDHRRHLPKSSAARSTGHRVKFHREDLKNKFSLHRHRPNKATTEEIVSRNPAAAAARLELDAENSLIATPLQPESSGDHFRLYSTTTTPDLAQTGEPVNTEERRRWFKKIFKHRQSGSEFESVSSGVESSATNNDLTSSSAVSFRTANEEEDDDFDDVEDAHRRRMMLLSQASGRSSESGWSIGAKSCGPALSPELIMNRTESSSPPGTMSRFKSKFRLRKNSSDDSQGGGGGSSCCSAEGGVSTPVGHNNIGLGSRKMTRASSTGTLASNCGAMSRRSYRIKLDHALQKAHLRRRNGLVDMTREYSASAGGGAAHNVGGGFMMAPDINDELKVHSAEKYHAVVIEAQHM